MPQPDRRFGLPGSAGATMHQAGAGQGELDRVLDFGNSYKKPAALRM
jgi:hypothetical protein